MELQEVDEEVSCLARSQEQADHRLGELQALHQLERQRVKEERELEKSMQEAREGERHRQAKALETSFEEMAKMVQGLEGQLHEGSAGVGVLTCKLEAQKGQLARAARDAEAAQLHLSALQAVAQREAAERESLLNSSVMPLFPLFA